MYIARLCYSLIYHLLLPLWILRIWLRGLGNPSYRARRNEHFGRVPMHQGDAPIWIHGVSLGEIRTIIPLVQRLREMQPQLPIWVTTSTPTGLQAIETSIANICHYSLSPLDTRRVLRRFFERVRPCLYVMAETELWPQSLALATERGVCCALVNARLSQRSTRRYALVQQLIFPLLNLVSARSDIDAERFRSLGAARVQVIGDLKLDTPQSADNISAGTALRQSWGTAPLWIAGSTHSGEDEQVLDAHRRIRTSIPDARLVLVPRHPERFDQVHRLTTGQGWKTARRSSGDSDWEVLVGDTMGELTTMYAAADVAFVGGSLVTHGGHNLAEPLACQTPPLSGQHLFNFEPMRNALLDAGALGLIANETELAKAVCELLRDSTLRQARIAAGQTVLAQHQGTRQRTCELLLNLLQ